MTENSENNNSRNTTENNPQTSQDSQQDSQENNIKFVNDDSSIQFQNNTELKDSKNKITQLEQKIAELNDKLLRSLAEVDNIRRRSREEIDKASKFAITNFVSDLITVTENFFMASENSPKEEIEKYPAIKNYATAIEMTEKELLKVLEKNNVKRIYPLNQNFDHNFHEAVTNIESDDKEEGVVMQVVQAGYTIADRLIRPALVGVAKAKTK